MSNKTFIKRYAGFNKPELKPVEVDLLSLIYSFQERGKECTMSSGWAGKYLNVSERTIARALERLERANYIFISKGTINDPRILWVNEKMFFD